MLAGTLRVSEEDGESRYRERAKALLCQRLFGEPSRLLTIGRFDLIRCLGRGGNGVAYEARDRDSGERVALKTLHRRSPRALYRFKREFRSLADLRHENLARLHELHVEGGEAYLIMELVPGCDFEEHLRSAARETASAARYEEAVRHAAMGLCEGISALHAAGKLHLDLKPSNVIVTPQGRVVVLDFGLVQDVDEPLFESAGTPSFMAPEQARGAVSRASDWYSFGRLLEQALESGGELAETSAQPPAERRPPRQELERLARALTSRDPGARPDEPAIRQIVCGARRSAPSFRRARPDDLVLGRRAERARLAHAFGEARTQPLVVLIRGESGIGKSTLMRVCVRDAVARGELFALRGRCYERESVPYNALDGLIDDLTSALIARDSPVPLAPREAEALLTLFPVLGRVPWIDRAESSLDRVEPNEQRWEAVAGLKKLLRALGDGRPVALCIDDLHWSDVDSIKLLAALLVREDGLAPLLVATDRTDASLTSSPLEQLRRSFDAPENAPAILEIELGPLSRGEAAELSAQIAEADQYVAEHARAIKLAARIAAESRGNPLFLLELWHAARRDPDDLAGDYQPASFERMLAARVAQLSEAAQSVLELLAIAKMPIAVDTATAAALVAGSSRGAVTELSRAGLAQVVRVHDQLRIVIVHDRLSETIARALSPARRRSLHEQLALALESGASAHRESLVEQYEAAGLSTEAARHARHAGELAFAALAFGRAADLFRRALRFEGFSPREKAAIQLALARALEHSGEALDAARAYEQAANGEDSPQRQADLLQRAAQLWMHAGRQREGERLLEGCYRRYGLVWPKRKAALIAATVRLGWSVRTRPSPLQQGGLHATEGADEALHAERAELLSAVGGLLQSWDMVRALYNALLVVREAEQTSDPVWHARALAVRGLLGCAGLMRGGEREGLALVETAWKVVDELGPNAIRTELDGLCAAAHLLAGRLDTSLLYADRWVESLRVERRSPLQFHSAVGALGTILLELGALREARERWPQFEHEARHNDDVVASYWIRAHPVRFAILFANDDREGALSLVAETQRLCERYPWFLMLRWSTAICRAETELHWGSALEAHRLFAEAWPELARADYAFMREQALLLRARLALGAAAELGDCSTARGLLRAANSDSRRLRRSDRSSVRAGAKLCEAGVAFLRHDRAKAREHLERAVQLFDGGENRIVAACARYHLASLRDELSLSTVASLLAPLHEEGIVHPQRWLRSLIPGLPADVVVR